MEQDKSPDTLSATSNFVQASNHLVCVTRAGASKSLDFSLASGLPPTKCGPRRLKLGEGDEVLLSVPRSTDPAAICSLQQIINCHVKDYGVDETGAPVQPPLIPLSRLVHMEYVQSVHKASEAVKILKERFEMEGSCQSIGAKFYVQARDAVW
jgi:hypothetical protein